MLVLFLFFPSEFFVTFREWRALKLRKECKSLDKNNRSFNLSCPTTVSKIICERLSLTFLLQSMKAAICTRKFSFHWLVHPPQVNWLWITRTRRVGGRLKKAVGNQHPWLSRAKELAFLKSTQILWPNEF